MKSVDITPVVDHIRETVQSHRLGAGSYARWLWQDKKNSRNLGEDEYGCADAMNILYTISDFPRDAAERAACVSHLQAMQGADGFFRSKDGHHHPFHTTAHCSAALELFDVAPLRQPTELSELLQPNKLEAFLEQLDWNHDPWDESHKGAGLYVFMNMTGMATPEWNARYFKWLWDNADPETGFWRGPVDKIDSKAHMFHYLAGSFHYLFNHEYAHMPLRYPEKVIDTCLALYDNELGKRHFGRGAGFSEIDWIFCLTRASRQTAHRFDDIRDRLERFAETNLDWWLHLDWAADEGVNDMHCLFGAVCALAELQQTLKGKILSDKPLRLVLDRRPFI